MFACVCSPFVDSHYNNSHANEIDEMNYQSLIKDLHLMHTDALRDTNTIALRLIAYRDKHDIDATEEKALADAVLKELAKRGFR
tara:strand:+ start:326 stop:577 length:252 start_codon:yes stop_codon:yes gene_type:complete